MLRESFSHWQLLLIRNVETIHNIAILFINNATSKNEKHFVIWSIIYGWMDKENEVCIHIIELYMYLNKRTSVSF